MDQQCAYCGLLDSNLTKDHVVPKAIWAGTPLPNYCITVPACDNCHNPRAWDGETEYFRNVLIAMLDMRPSMHKVAEFALKGSVIRSIQRNPKAKAELGLGGNIRYIARTSPGGIITDYAPGFPVDFERFNKIPEKIVRGLIYYKSAACLPLSHVVDVISGNEFWSMPEFQAVISGMSTREHMGDDVFGVRYARDKEDDFCSAWLFSFYKSICILVLTSPRL